MEFQVLGPVVVLQHGHNIVPTAPKPRQVMALLIMRRNSVVQTADLIDEVWEDGPPASAMTTLQTYIYKLRKLFAAHGEADRLHTRSGGYQLTVADTVLDLHHFERGAAEGQALLERGEAARARTVLGDALNRWRGPALVDVLRGGLLSSYVTRLEESRGQVLELRIEADLRIGRHRELVSELKSLTLTHPLHEHLHASLMVALYRSGRRYEALETYRTLRNNMIEDLGLEPGLELRELHQALLSDAPVGPAYEPSLAVYAAAPAPEEPAPDPAVPGGAAAVPGNAAAAGALRPAAAPLGMPVPAQLPPDVADFTGRRAAIDRLAAALADESGSGTWTAPRIVVISGMPGSGKTALGVHLGHRLRAHFPDGHLYADLAGSTPGAREPHQVLRGFLRGLGVPDESVPHDAEECGKLFRSLLDGRRVLVVLDDAASQATVRSLLPPGPGCAALVTSRRRLHGVEGAHRLTLEPLTRTEALELLAACVGEDQVRQERRAAVNLVEVCGRLPLALRCLGGRLAETPGLTLTRLCQQLSDQDRVLDELSVGDLDVRSRYDSSYAGLSRTEKGMFRLLSMLGPEYFTVEAAADLLGWETSAAERTLTGFVDRHLVNVTATADGRTRYTMPGVTRLYAGERLSSMLQGGAPRQS